MRRTVSWREYALTSVPVNVRDSKHASLEIYRIASLILVTLSILIAALLAVVAGVRIKMDGVATLAWVVAALLVVARILRSSHGHSKFADFFGTLGLVWIAAISCGVIAMLGLRLQMPMVDGLLRSADHVLGLDGIAVVGWLMRQGQWIFSIMAAAYAYTIPALVLSMLALAAAGERLEAWRATFCFIGSLFSICLVAIATPAKGLGVWASPEMLKHLPVGAMRYFWAHFDSFYAGSSPALSLDTIDGVISFPSFHAAMGFTTVAMWRKNLVVFSFASIWLGFMLLATLPYGGHYFVDLIGGLAVGMTWFVLSKAIEARCTTGTAALKSVPIGLELGRSQSLGSASMYIVPERRMRTRKRSP